MDILDKINENHIILASKSPRRRKLLEELGINFTVTTIDVREEYPQKLKKEEIALYLCELKANAFPKNNIHSDTVIITADTIVWFNNKVLNKPINRQEAILSLEELSGHTHEVITGVCIRTLHKTRKFHVNTEVTFRKLITEEITHYVDQYKPFDKAGAYGIQEWIGYVGIEKIKGSFHNVVGLPVTRLYEELCRILVID